TISMSVNLYFVSYFFFSSRRRHTRFSRDWSSDVCSSDLLFILLKTKDGPWNEAKTVKSCQRWHGNFYNLSRERIDLKKRPLFAAHRGERMGGSAGDK